MKNQIIDKEKVFDLASNLLRQVITKIVKENEKNEVDEIVENIKILYDKPLFEECEEIFEFDNSKYSFTALIESLKTKKYPSLSNKTVFKFMDMMEA
jgi:hypothetical protein